jgi:hypothetical protein
MIPQIPIEKTKERMLYQPLQHFVNEGQWKVVFLCCRVELSVIDTHSPPHDGSLWDKFIFAIFNDRHSSFL